MIGTQQWPSKVFVGAPFTVESLQNPTRLAGREQRGTSRAILVDSPVRLFSCESQPIRFTVSKRTRRLLQTAVCRDAAHEIDLDASAVIGRCTFVTQCQTRFPDCRLSALINLDSGIARASWSHPTEPRRFSRDVAHDGSRAPIRRIDRTKRSLLTAISRYLAQRRVHWQSIVFRSKVHTSWSGGLFHVSARTCHLSIAHIAGFSHFRGERLFVLPFPCRPPRRRVLSRATKSGLRKIADRICRSAIWTIDARCYLAVPDARTHAFAVFARARGRRRTRLRENNTTSKPSPGWLTLGAESKNRRAPRPRTLRSVTARGHQVRSRRLPPRSLSGASQTLQLRTTTHFSYLRNPNGSLVTLVPLVLRKFVNPLRGKLFSRRFVPAVLYFFGNYYRCRIAPSDNSTVTN